jgi:solute carrier family 9 (sodium/hydrogen exchanger), member 8
MMLVLPWGSYLIGEWLSLSGIVSIIITGIVMASYSMPNLSKASRQSVESIYISISHNCEAIIFLFLGMGLVGF